MTIATVFVKTNGALETRRRCAKNMIENVLVSFYLYL